MFTGFARTVILYAIIIAGIRLMGKRQVGELEPSELVLSLIIADLASVPMQDYGIPLLSGVVPILTLLSLTMVISVLTMKSPGLRAVLCGRPSVIVANGKLDQREMARNRLTADELMEELRGQGYGDLSAVHFAILETNGRLSVLLRSDRQPVTSEQLAVSVSDDVTLPTIVINDGRVLTDNLKQAGRDERWLQQELKRQGAAHSRDVFLLSVDEQGAVVCLKKESAR